MPPQFLSIHLSPPATYSPGVPVSFSAEITDDAELKVNDPDHCSLFSVPPLSLHLTIADFINL